MPGVYNGTHQREREAALKALQPGTPCPLCGKPMFRNEKLDFHHVQRLVDGGNPRGKRVLAHAHCNRSDNAHRGEARFPQPGKVTSPAPKDSARDQNGRFRKEFHETCSAGVRKVVIRKGLCLRDIASCSHDFRKCEHHGSAIWDWCEECQRYSKAITMHAVCLAEGGEVAGWYTVDGLPAWDIPADCQSPEAFIAGHVAETGCSLH